MISQTCYTHASVLKITKLLTGLPYKLPLNLTTNPDVYRFFIPNKKINKHLQGIPLVSGFRSSLWGLKSTEQGSIC